MNRIEFENKLYEELKTVPFVERENALKYYREYFDDAGIENEQKVIEELESPEIIARGIKSDLGLTEEKPQNPDHQNIRETLNISGNNHHHNNNNNTNDNAKNIFTEKMWFGKHPIPVWAVILFSILFIPVIIPLLSGAFGMAIGGVLGAIGIAIGFIAVSAAILIAGVAVTVAGISTIVAGAIYNGILLIGIGFTLIGLGVLSLLFAIQFIIVWIPMFIRWIIQLFRNGFRNSTIRKGEYA